MTAHPMIVPHEPRDSEKLQALSADARLAFQLLYDMVDGYSRSQPVWQVTRYVVNVHGALFGAERRSLTEPGWRAVPSLSAIPAPTTGLPQITGSEEGSVRITGYTSKQAVPAKMTLGDFIVHMEQNDLGRPSTYAAHSQKLLDEAWICSITDVSLSDKGQATLQAIRNSPASRFNANFTRAFLNGLDAIESSRLTPESAIRQWLSAGHAELAVSWLNGMQIQGDAADVFYEARDEADRRTIPWPPGMVPPEIDPECLLPSDSPYRAHRVAINEEAAKRAGNWLSLSPTERIDLRILVDAESIGISPAAWRVAHEFDLLRRWLVGWTL